MNVILCEEKTDRLEVHVRADIKDGKLTISGQDPDTATEEFWGNSDYEYWYYFDEGNNSILAASNKAL